MRRYLLRMVCVALVVASSGFATSCTWLWRGDSNNSRRLGAMWRELPSISLPPSADSAVHDYFLGFDSMLRPTIRYYCDFGSFALAITTSEDGSATLLDLPLIDHEVNAQGIQGITVKAPVGDGAAILSEPPKGFTISLPGGPYSASSASGAGSLAYMALYASASTLVVTLVTTRSISAVVNPSNESNVSTASTTVHRGEVKASIVVVIGELTMQQRILDAIDWDSLASQ